MMLRIRCLAVAACLLFIGSTLSATAQEERGKKLYDRAQSMGDRYSKQVRLLEEASDLGYLPANQRLLWYYSNGVYRSFPKDEQKAFYYIMRSAAAGDSAGMMFVAGAYLSGFGTSKDLGKAIEWYEKSAGAGNAVAMLRLGELYALPNEPVRNPTKSGEWFMRAAGAGNLESQERLALQHKDCDALWQLFLKYDNMPGGTANAHHIAYVGSDAGCGKCSYEMYVYHDHRENSSESALRYLRKAKDQGIAISPVEIERVEKEIADEGKKPYAGYINSNAPGVTKGSTSAPAPQAGERKCPYCKGAGQIKVEGEKSSYTDNFGHQHGTYAPLHWNACSHCNGTGYIAR